MKKRLLFALLSFLIASSSLLAQSKTVSGTVNDSGGQGIPGVSVRVKNSNKGISTNGDGKFSLEVGSNAVLVFSAVGYTSKEVTVGNSSTINVELSEDAANLDEIVVSGLATNVKRSNLANAVSRLSSKDLTGTTTPVTTDGAI